MLKSKLTRFMMMIAVMALFVTMSGMAFADDVAKPAEKAKPMSDQPGKSKMKGMLDGKHFMGEAGESGKTTGDKEMMNFSNGMFHSSQCQAKGFAPAPYTATKEGDAIDFSCDLANKEGAKVHWSGKVTGNAIDATATMIQEGKDPMTMWAKGTESAKKPGMTHEHRTAETKTGK